MEENKFAESFLDFSGMPESMEELLKGKEEWKPQICLQSAELR